MMLMSWSGGHALGTTEREENSYEVMGSGEGWGRQNGEVEPPSRLGGRGERERGSEVRD